MSTPRRGVEPFGDAALVAQVADPASARRLSAAISSEQWHGVQDIVPALKSVTVIVDPEVVDLVALAQELRSLPERVQKGGDRKIHELPVVFDGPDLDEVAALCSTTPGDVVAQLEKSPLEVAFLGFTPGFAYMVGLPDPLRAISRRAEPRQRVNAGSFAVAGGFAGVYPQPTPGGWRILGRTDAMMFDPEADPPATFAPGDIVHVRPVPDVSLPPTQTDRALLRARSSRRAVVMRPGFQSIVQDLGRRGVAWCGVPRAGAADSVLLRIANRAAGNADRDSAIEFVGDGPTIRFDADAYVALAGDAPLAIDGSRRPDGAVYPVRAGQIVEVGPVRSGARAYLGVSGGFDIPRLFGSRSSDTLARLGVGPLRVGDQLAIGPPTRPRARLHLPHPGSARIVLRVLLAAASPPRLDNDVYTVEVASDRVGIRLRRSATDRLAAARTMDAGSTPGPRGGNAAPPEPRGMVTGALQFPHVETPIVLGCDHATVGGYPTPACVASADWPKLGQLRSGDTVSLDLVGLDEASLLRSQLATTIDRSVEGWFPARAADGWLTATTDTIE